MDNKEAKKMVNNKLKLYRNARIGQIATGIASSALATGLTYSIGKGLIHTTSNNYLKLAYILSSALFATCVSAIPFVYSLNFTDNNNELETLKEIKKELKKGNNRFININKEDFDIELGIASKQYTKNKVK